MKTSHTKQGEGVTSLTAPRGVRVGTILADSITGLLHLMYNKGTALRVLDSLVAQLKLDRKEFE